MAEIVAKKYLGNTAAEWVDQGYELKSVPTTTLQLIAKELIHALVFGAHQPLSRDLHYSLHGPVILRSMTRKAPFAIAEVGAGNSEWTVLTSDQGVLLEIARTVVRYGIAEGLAKDGSAIPYAKYNHLVAVDRTEIESFRSIKRLLDDYRDDPRAEHPLCLAVFGPPGSGKSFGVKQLARGSGIASSSMLEFNMSQFSTTEDLETALIKIQEKSVAGVLPLVFFDEFDCSFGGTLGWLKYFLSVMQDGEFSFRGNVLHVGRCVLVFAGGTSASYKQFARLSESATTGDRDAFKAVKGPDFISRLRGRVDVTGINPCDPLDQSDGAHFLRRAIVIRSLLERRYPRLIAANGEAKIDEGIICALLGVSEYQHGARSLTAIFDMSALSRAERFEKSRLPPRHQLEMHLGTSEKHDAAQEFLDLVGRA